MDMQTKEVPEGSEHQERNDELLTLEEMEEMAAEVRSLDIGETPRSEEEAQLYRYLKARGRLSDEIERITASTDALVRRLNNRIKGLDHVFQASAAALVASMIEGRRSRSVATPFGTCGFRKLPTRVVVRDESALPEVFFEMVRRRNDAAIRDHFKATGELPAGCEIAGGNDQFYVK